MVKENKVIYDTPKYGVYNYLCKNIDGSLSPYKSDVEVVGETAKRFLIRLSEPIRDHKVGDVIEVLKRSVKLNRDCSDDSWNRD